MSRKLPKRQEMYFKLHQVTPKQAVDWLTKANIDNRRVRTRWVERIRTDILAGNWRLTHQAIAFDCMGVLLDGQHRLHAIANGDRPVPIWVAYNVPSESGVAVDCGDKRSVVDAGRHIGMELTNREAAVGNAMAAGMESRWPTKSRQEQLEFLAVHIVAIRFAVEALTPKRSKLSHAAIGAVFARAYYHADPECLRRAAVIHLDGVPPDGMFLPGDRSIGLLRTFTLSVIGKSGSHPRRAMYVKAQRAVYAFTEQQDLTKLYDAREEYFPLPENGQGVDADMIDA